MRADRLGRQRVRLGSIETGIRRCMVNGREVYRVQLGGRRRGNRVSQVCATLADALALKKQWQTDGLPTGRVRLVVWLPQATMERLRTLSTDWDETVTRAVEHWLDAEPAAQVQTGCTQAPCK